MSAHIITALEALITREIDPLEKKVFTFRQIHAGTACNVIPEVAILQGTLRCFNEEVRSFALRRLGEISRGVACALGGNCEVEIVSGYPVVQNDPEVTSIVREAAGEVLPTANISETTFTLGAEDISYFLREVPGCYFFLGTANREKGITECHHSPRFNIDEEALPIGVEIVRRTIKKILGRRTR